MIKQFFFILISFFVFTSLEQINAQTIIKQNTNTSQDNDEVVVAHTHHNRNILFIKSKNTSLKIKSIIFYSILGVQVSEFTINSNSMEINIDKLRSGKYLMKYTLSNNTQQVIQIIKH